MLEVSCQNFLSLFLSGLNCCIVLVAQPSLPSSHNLIVWIGLKTKSNFERPLCENWTIIYQVMSCYNPLFQMYNFTYHKVKILKLTSYTTMQFRFFKTLQKSPSSYSSSPEKDINAKLKTYWSEIPTRRKLKPKFVHQGSFTCYSFILL